MALARRFDVIGGAHPRSTFLGGILVGGLGAIFGTMLVVAAFSDSGTAAQRTTVLGAAAGATYLDDADAAGRVVISSGDAVAVDTARTEVQAAPRVIVQPDDSSSSSLRDSWSALVERARNREVRYGTGTGAAAIESDEVWREALASEAAAAYRGDVTGPEASVLPPSELDELWDQAIGANTGSAIPTGVGSAAAGELPLTPEVGGFVIAEGYNGAGDSDDELTLEEAGFIAFGG